MEALLGLAQAALLSHFEAGDADRQTFAEHEEQMKPLEQMKPVEQVTIRFWVRSDIAADLLLYLDETRRRHGAAYPIWAVFAALFAPVREEWLRRDPQRRKIRCQRHSEHRCSPGIHQDHRPHAPRAPLRTRPLPRRPAAARPPGREDRE